ncbi:hypothetical protein [Geobacter argillaceus]|uniref:hypothetical protein n=1 Tax=Geobacter argillaceus TaxID=345631 RepID=UPI0011A302E7|nr:hypothetical protein [Geobacter argillaceus]
MKLALLIGLLTTFIVGIVCLIWPEKVQEYALKCSMQGVGKFNPFLSWMKTRSYIITLRIIGVAAVIAVALVIYVVFKGE